MKTVRTTWSAPRRWQRNGGYHNNPAHIPSIILIESMAATRRRFELCRDSASYSYSDDIPVYSSSTAMTKGLFLAEQRLRNARYRQDDGIEKTILEKEMALNWRLLPVQWQQNDKFREIPMASDTIVNSKRATHVKCQTLKAVLTKVTDINGKAVITIQIRTIEVLTIMKGAIFHLRVVLSALCW